MQLDANARPKGLEVCNLTSALRNVRGNYSEISSISSSFSLTLFHYITLH